jgi:hypothetical protein
MKENSPIVKSFIILLFVLFAAPALFAQEEPRGVIIYASGTGFEHIRNGDTREYDLSVDVAEGVELRAGDYLNTYDGTFLEIQVYPSDNVLKVSENTSFKVNEVSPQGGGNFELNYGRVRARVKKLAGLEKFSLEGPSMVAGVRGTDFGYDIIYEKSESTERTVASVYCFEGRVEVETREAATLSEAGEDAAEAEEAEKRATTVIGPEEMVRLVERRRPAPPEEGEAGPGEPGQEQVEYALIKESVSDTIETYWNEYDFEGSLLERTKEEKEEKPVVVERQGLEVEQRRDILRTAGAVSGGLGILFGSATLTFAYADALLSDMNNDTRDSYTLGLGAMTGLFLSTSLFSYLFSLW